ncbi:LysR substrate-binding domain-containing protein [Acerihabitans sp. KWT182]|uniref:LysR substrate-binding domain-containing protein n=1 Tax=Acerihabitans sp. KWT182 TaxID=3157919 RepID=A0AAU7QE95_9GAMM
MIKRDPRLKAFHSVVTLGGFSKAAEALALSQQAVSFHIKSLEDEVGARLLQRQGKNLGLTETGEILFHYARQILDLYSAAEDALAKKNGISGGTLSIGATGSIAKYCLPRIIGEFRKVYPTVSIAVSVANSEKISELLAREEIDLGLISGGSVDLSRFTVEPFFEDELVFVAATENPLAKTQDLSLADIVACEFVIREKGSGTRTLMESYFHERGTDLSSLSVAAVMGSTDAVKESVASTESIAMVSMLSLGDLKYSGLTVLDTDFAPLLRSFYIIRLRDSYFRRILDDFVKTLRAGNQFRHADNENNVTHFHSQEKYKE